MQIKSFSNRPWQWFSPPPAATTRSVTHNQPRGIQMYPRIQTRDTPLQPSWAKVAVQCNAIQSGMECNSPDWRCCRGWYEACSCLRGSSRRVRNKGWASAARGGGATRGPLRRSRAPLRRGIWPWAACGGPSAAASWCSGKIPAWHQHEPFLFVGFFFFLISKCRRLRLCLTVALKTSTGKSRERRVGA